MASGCVYRHGAHAQRGGAPPLSGGIIFNNRILVLISMCFNVCWVSIHYMLFCNGAILVILHI